MGQVKGVSLLLLVPDFSQIYLLEVICNSEEVVTVILGRVSFDLLAPGSLVLQHLVVLVQAIYQQSQKELGLLFLFWVQFAEGFSEKTEGQLDVDGLRVDRFLGRAGVAVEIVESVGEVGHVVGVEDGVLRVLVDGRLLGRHPVLLLVVQLPHIVDVLAGKFEYLVALGIIVGFYQLGRLHLLRAPVADEVVNVLVFEVQVESRITEVLPGAETFVSGCVFILLGLGASSLLWDILICPELGVAVHPGLYNLFLLQQDRSGSGSKVAALINRSLSLKKRIDGTL